MFPATVGWPSMSSRHSRLVNVLAVFDVPFVPSFGLTARTSMTKDTGSVFEA